MIIIRFIEDYAPKDGSGRTFAVGQEIEMREDSARHYISRRKAVAVNHEITAPPVQQTPESFFTDKIEAKAEESQEKKRGRKPGSVSGAKAFENGNSM